jgi:hypothetical protein
MQNRCIQKSQGNRDWNTMAQIFGHWTRRKSNMPNRYMPRLIRMKMMDCSALGMLVVNHEPIKLIDVRSKNEFAAMHIPGARSVG